MMDLLITFSLIFPWLAILGLITYWIWKRRRSLPPISHTPSQAPTWQSTTITKTESKPEKETPKFADLTIDERDWDEKYPGAVMPDMHSDSAQARVYRVYRSTNRKEWAECDPVLTERAACNYAAYIKANNPTEYVRVEDPNGLILFYE
jgi:hypothetical protein